MRQVGSERVPEIDVSDAVDVPIETWRDAERLGFVLMLALGYEDSRLTGDGGDGGIDVLAREAVCQVKHQSDKVRRPAVQQLHGAALGRTAVFLSWSGFNAGATQWATEAGVALFQYDLGARIWPVNPEAHALAARCDLKPMSGREKALAQRVARAHRWMAAISSEASRVAGLPPVGWLDRRRRSKQVAVYQTRLPRLQKLFGKVEATTRMKVASLLRLDTRLAELERELKAAARRLSVKLPE